jgi:hypothetical protein
VYVAANVASDAATAASVRQRDTYWPLVASLELKWNLDASTALRLRKSSPEDSAGHEVSRQKAIQWWKPFLVGSLIPADSDHPVASTLVSSERYPCDRSWLIQLGSKDGSSFSVVCRSGILVPLIQSPLVTRRYPKATIATIARRTTQLHGTCRSSESCP